MEAKRLVFQCLSGSGLALVIYGAFVIGAEIGGLIEGYPGAGREFHEKVMNRLKQVFRKNNKRKK